MPLADLKPGLTHTATLMVDASLTVPQVSPRLAAFADMPPVFATAFLVAFVEATCIEAIRPYLDAGQHSVGTHVGLSHNAATPVGMQVTARVELVAVEGRRLRFKVACRDEVDVIGEGHHERFVIDHVKFTGRVQAKANRSPVEGKTG